MWYAIQTMTGREQELIDIVDARTDHNTYERCFCVRREAVWRREGRYITHIESLFPGYVFVETQDPESFYLQLKKIPKFSRLLGKDIAGTSQKSWRFLKPEDPDSSAAGNSTAKNSATKNGTGKNSGNVAASEKPGNPDLPAAGKKSANSGKVSISEAAAEQLSAENKRDRLKEGENQNERKDQNEQSARSARKAKNGPDGCDGRDEGNSRSGRNSCIKRAGEEEPPGRRIDGRVDERIEQRMDQRIDGQIRGQFDGRSRERFDERIDDTAKKQTGGLFRYPACSRPSHPLLWIAGGTCDAGEDRKNGNDENVRDSGKAPEVSAASTAFTVSGKSGTVNRQGRPDKSERSESSESIGKTGVNAEDGREKDQSEALCTKHFRNPGAAGGTRTGSRSGQEGILFHPVSEEEETFLKQLIGDDPDNVVRLSPVELDENSEIIKCGGALSYYKDAIIKKRIRLRYVVVRVPLFGRNRDILLGIRVEKEKILNMLDMD